MAARRKTANSTDLPGDSDPRAQLDGAALLGAVKPLLKELAADLLVRADGSLAVTEALKARHAAEQQAERTADGYPEWRRAFVDQVAAAWLLSCVFVRTLEDRGLLGRNRIAGPGAEDNWKAFQQLAPSLSEREYLLMVFKELSRLPAAADLFDVRHNPVWLLGPSAEKARMLLDLFRGPTADAPRFRFGGEDTRFLGDLYQDLSEDVRKRFALLQTPRFIERFILDRTLEPAIERFGLNDTNLIDPTCGSGHFLLGAFERLFDHRLRVEPGLSARDAATKALDAVAGSDINAYAIAVARFRLTLAFVEKCGITRLKDLPRLPLHLAVADSLLYNPQIGQLALVEGTDAAKWEGAHFSLEDPKAARDVLFKQYAAVVGNPPYITVKDAVLRDRYREIYSAAYREYSLGVPFTQRFFQLGREGAHVGMITANSFMKREFGRLLIEDYLGTVNLDLVVNTSGAYIPGHGTPTVLMFGTAERAKGSDVLAVLANRGEPTTPDDAERGQVWSSIAEHWSDVGFENEFISIARVTRAVLAKHPWSLGGGGASELMASMARAQQRLASVTDSIGFMCITKQDDVFSQPSGVFERLGIDPRALRSFVIGEHVRNWSIGSDQQVFFPYDDEGELRPIGALAGANRCLWPFRTVLESRAVFGGQTFREAGRPWYSFGQIPKDRIKGRVITFAFVATHNHFALDSGGKVFNRSAPIVKLPDGATEDDHLVLLAYLNSSIACFWMKQVMMNKGGSGVGRGVQDEAWESRFEFDGTKLATVPVPSIEPPVREVILAIVRAQLQLARHRESCFGRVAVSRWTVPGTDLIGVLELEQRLDLAKMCVLQEELDWIFYESFGLLEETEVIALRQARDAALPQFPASVCPDKLALFNTILEPGRRPFEVLLSRSAAATGRHTAWFERNDYETPANSESGDVTQYQRLNALRLDVIQNNSFVSIVERAEYKRRWAVRDWEQEFAIASKAYLADSLERVGKNDPQIRSVRAMLRAASSDARFLAMADLTLKASHDYSTGLDEIVTEQSVPYLSTLRFSESGIEKYSTWESAWELQRRDDEGQPQQIAVPSKYGREDFLSPAYWSLRGKLDVPNERFISYPGCESDEDRDPVYGWAGWDHLQRAVALAGLYQDRKQREGWAKDRLLPMLAGLLELLPWLKQWHHEPNADLGGERPSDQFDAFLNAECAELGFTHDDLRAWRPATKVRASANPKTRGKSKTEPEESAGTP